MKVPKKKRKISEKRVCEKAVESELTKDGGGDDDLSANENAWTDVSSKNEETGSKEESRLVSNDEFCDVKKDRKEEETTVKGIKKKLENDEKDEADSEDGEGEETLEYIDADQNTNSILPDDIFLKRFARPSLTKNELNSAKASLKTNQKQSHHSACLKQLNGFEIKGGGGYIDDEVDFDAVVKRSFDDFTLERLSANWSTVHRRNNWNSSEKNLYGALMSYKDLFMPTLNSDNLNKVQNVIVLHLLNHVFKCRASVLHHNKQLKHFDANKIDYDPENYRDQCITRPSVLILTPFRNFAFNIITTLIRIFEDSKVHKATKKKRFKRDFGPEGFEPVSEYRPQDYLDMMFGNVDDDFKIGLSISPKKIRLYSHFYRSDVVVASPLGLFQVVGDAKDKSRELDFLSGIQVVYLDQTDVFLMQNWSHVISIFQNLNQKPDAGHEVNFSRVYEWCLDEQTKYFRQTIITSRFKAPEFNALFTKFCSNAWGKIDQIPPVTVNGELHRVATDLVHVFRKFPASSYAKQDDERFEFFTKDIITEFRDLEHSKIVIFISDYFEFVRLRNFMRRSRFDFLAISEYDAYEKAKMKMKKFRKSGAKFVLITERFHFFNRLFLRGLERIFFYQLPRYPHFYSELCNMIGVDVSEGDKEFSCSALYCIYDCLKLAPIVTDENCKKLLSSSNSTNMFITGRK